MRTGTRDERRGGRSARSLLSRFAAVAAVLAMTATGCLAQSAAGLADVQREIAAENAAIAAQTTAARATLDHIHERLRRVKAARADLDASMGRIESYAKLPGLGAEFVQSVIDELRALPRHPTFLARAAREQEAVAISDAHLRSQRALRALADIDAAAAQRTQGAGRSASAAPADAAIRAALVKQVAALKELVAVQQHLIEAVGQLHDTELALLKRGDEARGPLARLLFWIPVRPAGRTVTELGDSLAWSFSPAHWAAAGSIAAEEFRRAPRWPALALGLAALLYAARRRLIASLATLSPAAVGFDRYNIGHTLRALAATVGLALPLPLVLQTAALLLHGNPDAADFPRALGDTLHATAPLLLCLTAGAWLLDRRGVGVRHFGWDETALSFAAREVRRLTAAFMPIMFVAALNGLDHAPFANRESLSRVLVILGMLVLAAFLGRLLRMRNPIMQLVKARAPRSWAVRLHAVWFAAVLAVPLGVAVLSLAGYFLAASYFVGRMVRTLFFLTTALLFYGLAALWVQVKGVRYAQRHEHAVATAPASLAAAGGNSLPARRPLADITAIGEQTRALLDLGVTLALLVMMWWVWGDSVPMLSQIGDYVMWTYTEIVDEKKITKLITVGSVFLALLIAAGTAVAVRNIGALLDIVFLQRLEVQADATYAIKVTVRYLIAAVGIMAASSLLGIGWSDVQWLVAALGVGLGFGLQEIFAQLRRGHHRAHRAAGAHRRRGHHRRRVRHRDAREGARDHHRRFRQQGSADPEQVADHRPGDQLDAVQPDHAPAAEGERGERQRPRAGAAGDARGAGGQSRRPARPAAARVLRRLRRRRARPGGERVRRLVRQAPARAARDLPRHQRGAEGQRHPRAVTRRARRYMPARNSGSAAIRPARNSCPAA